jgi:hypothetical protein
VAEAERRRRGTVRRARDGGQPVRQGSTEPHAREEEEEVTGHQPVWRSARMAGGGTWTAGPLGRRPLRATPAEPLLEPQLKK